MEAMNEGSSASTSKSSRYMISVAKIAPPRGAPKIAPIPEPIPLPTAIRASAGLRSKNRASNEPKPALI